MLSPERVTVAVFVARLMDASRTPATAASAASPLDTHPPHLHIERITNKKIPS